MAAIVAGSQILGGLATPQVRKLFRLRTSALLAAEALSVLSLVLIGLIESFWAVIGLIVCWGLLFAAAMPIRQAYLNGLIPSQQRATILSFDSLMSSSGGVVAQPILGRAADVWGYPASYLLSGAISALSLPFIARSRRENAPADLGDPTAPRARRRQVVHEANRPPRSRGPVAVSGPGAGYSSSTSSPTTWKLRSSCTSTWLPSARETSTS